MECGCESEGISSLLVFLHLVFLWETCLRRMVVRLKLLRQKPLSEKRRGQAPGGSGETVACHRVQRVR